MYVHKFPERRRNCNGRTSLSRMSHDAAPAERAHDDEDEHVDAAKKAKHAHEESDDEDDAPPEEEVRACCFAFARNAAG